MKGALMTLAAALAIGLGAFGTPVAQATDFQQIVTEFVVAEPVCAVVEHVVVQPVVVERVQRVQRVQKVQNVQRVQKVQKVVNVQNVQRNRQRSVEFSVNSRQRQRLIGGNQRQTSFSFSRTGGGGLLGLGVF